MFQLCEGRDVYSIEENEIEDFKKEYYDEALT